MDQRIHDTVFCELQKSFVESVQNLRGTFKNWPVGFISPDELVAEGIFYSRVADRCICLFCRKIFSEWKDGCSVKEKHYKISPDCFDRVMKCKATNFWNPKRVHIDPYKKRHRGLVDLLIARFKDDRMKERIIIDNSENTPKKYSKDFENAGIYFHHNIVYVRKYIGEDERLKTFQEWPSNIITRQFPNDLAEAGFFYTGISDFVACFSCGIIIGSFEDNDNAWIEHAKWGPYCRYLSLKKNPRFLKGFRAIYQFDTSTGKYNRISTKVTTTPTASAAAVVAKPKTTTPLLKSHSVDSSIIFFDDEKDEANCASTYDEGDGKRVCKICFSNPAAAIFLPCAHMVACCSCVRDDLVSCPICKENIEIAFKPYLSISTRVNTDEKKIVEEGKKETREQQRNEIKKGEGGEEEKKENINIIINNTMKNFTEEFEEKKEKSYPFGECVTCRDDFSEIVYLPCAHMINCASCALLSEKCPLCREPITYAFRPVYY